MQGTHSLADIEVLAGLAADQRAGIVADCRWRSVERGSQILSAQTESTDVFFLTRGRVRVTIYSPSGREVAFRDLGPGASFGELAAIDGQSRSASVVALDECVLATISRERFWRLIEASPAVAAHVMRSLTALVRDLTARVVDTTTRTVPQRVRAEVVRLAREAGVADNSASIGRFPVHADLANHIGATREAVTRELGRLAREGLIERRGGRLLVHDVDALVTVIGDM